MVDELNPNTTNESLTPDEIAELKAQLEAELKAKAEFEASIASKDAKIVELDTEVSRLTRDLEAVKTELATASTSHAEVKAQLEQAVSKYRDLIVASNPHLADFIQGASIDEINTSVENARALVEKVKAAIELETKQATVPAGAPVRTTVIPEGMSSREKIVYGLGLRR